MDHGASALNSTFWTFSTTSMDFDFMDKPFSQGSWLQTTDRLNFLESEPFISSVQYDHSKCSSFNTELENPPLVYPEEHVVETATWLVQSEGAELGKRSSVEPNCSVKDRLMLAVEYLKNYVEDSGVLIQIWVPTRKGGQIVLTTIDQPYSLNSTCRSLASYRSVSKTFHLTTEEDSKESAGLPGRVFLRKLPEWTPDVRFFRSDECPRKNYAKLYSISGCLALPVFEQDSGICLAVVEIVTTTQKINYHLEIEIVCKALEAVDLKSSQDLFPFGVKACNEFYQIAIPEISEILQSVCETHSLPLAVTWALCVHEGESECQKFSEKYDNCISTVDSACYVADNNLLGFLEACSEQYLFLDQGIVGKAFTTKTQWFATDITSFSKTKYPLSHHARMFNLRAALAIPLRNMYTGLVKFVLELFLPRDCKDIEEQKHMWDFLSIVIQQSLKSFHVIMDKLDDEVNMQILGIEKFVSYPSKEHIQRNKHFDFVSWECPKEEPDEEFKVITHWDDNGLGLYQEQVFSEFEELQQSTKVKHCAEGGDKSPVGQDCSLSNKRAADKRQAKNEKTISLQILRQYFAGSLKDAAKSLGVCPTTLKRICRQHGINRWPSRKIKKVNHSLRKLQLVVNSIHGAEGLLQIDSFYKNFPELNSPGKDHISSFKMSDNSKEHEGGQRRLKVPDSKSPSSSCSQNSGSSTCYSTEAKQPGLNNGCSLPVDDPIIVLNKPRSETKLHFLNQEEEKVLERSQIQNCQSLPPLPTGRSLRDGVIFRVKASYGEENIRFSFLPNWDFNDLQQEIAKRFKIDNFSRIDLKYLDIDQEPVLLTCDADLEECIDLLKFSQTDTIKISLHQASQPKI